MNFNDKTTLINKIKALEGLTDHERSALLGLLRESKAYGLVWEDKPEAVEERLRDELPVLTEVPERALVSDTPDAPNHILIEGDNLEALTTLTYTHAGQIDVIYIDPPYNTGNKDFVYNDSFVDREDCYRHSKWLSFMSRRLRIAKQLLSDKGVIFISIDDNEQAQLKLLCDEVFGEENFVGSYFWKRTSTPPALSYKIRRKLEFVICYQKTDLPQRTFAQGFVDGGDAPLLNGGNPLGILKFPEETVQFNLPDGTYSHESGQKIKLLDAVQVVDGKNANAFRAEANFKWGQANLEQEIENGTYFLIKSKQFSIRYQKSTKATKVPSNIIDEDVLVGTNEDAQKEVADFALDASFNYAKPVSLISFLIKMPFWENTTITILDFFAGSGTTLHATMQLNAEDGGHRQCILVTNNENNICEAVTYERNKRVIRGYTTPKGEHVAGLAGNNLRYYRTDFVGREPSNLNMRRLVNLSTDMLCIKENLYTEQPTCCGERTHRNVFRYFDNGRKRMLVIYREEAIGRLVELIYGMDVEDKIKIYVFSPSEDPWEDLFDDVADKVELCALPAAIYNAYRRILPKKRNAAVTQERDEAATYKAENLVNGMLNFTDEGDEA